MNIPMFMRHKDEKGKGIKLSSTEKKKEMHRTRREFDDGREYNIMQRVFVCSVTMSRYKILVISQFHLPHSELRKRQKWICKRDFCGSQMSHEDSRGVSLIS